MFRSMAGRHTGSATASYDILPNFYPARHQQDCVESLVWRLLSHFGISALYEGVTYPIAWNGSGNVTAACRPDFTLLRPDGEPLLNIECTTAGRRKYCRFGQTERRAQTTLQRKLTQHERIVELYSITTLIIGWEEYRHLRRDKKLLLKLITQHIGYGYMAA